MRRISALVTIAFLAGLGIGLLVQSAVVTASRQTDTHAADLAAIEKLHKADEEATLTQDPTALTDLWSDDCVKVDVPGGPVAGKKAMRELYEKNRTEHPDFQVLKYTTDIKEVQIVDEWAIEVGYTEAAFKMSANADPVTFPRTKVMRVLKRQSDGSWKFALVGMK